MVPRRGQSSHSPPEPESRSAIGLGSNLGDRREHLIAAVAGLRRLGELTATSSLWETAPVGDVPQGDYLNAVVILDTIRGPGPLLEQLLAIESAAGRLRGERWGPRIIDLDLLLYSDAVIDTPGLQLPHPRMHQRRFVLAPLAEVWPDAVVPGRGKVADLVAAVSDQKMRWVEGPQWALEADS